VDFSNGGNGTLLDHGEYKVGEMGGWNKIFVLDRSSFTQEWTIPWSMLQEGVNNVSIRVFDLIGHEDETSDHIIFLKDSNEPVIKRNQKVYGWYNTDPGKVMDVDFQANDNASSLDYAAYSIREEGDWKPIVNETILGGVFVNFTDEWEIPWDELHEGINTIDLMLFDKAGNEDKTTDYITIKRDTLSPYAPELRAPGDGTSLYYLSSIFYWSAATDRGLSGISNYTFEMSHKGSGEVLISDITEDLSYELKEPLVPGSYTWRVRATDVVGNIGEWSLSWELTIKVNNPPVADAGINMVTTMNYPIVLSASGSYDPDGDNISYRWDFDVDDGIDVQSIERNPTCTYTKTGTYTVTLMVRDEYGESDTDTIQVKVNSRYIQDEDGDGYTNEEELEMGTDPLSSEDHPETQKKDSDGDGILDFEDEDDDGDGISDEEEYLMRVEGISGSAKPDVVSDGAQDEGDGAVLYDPDYVGEDDDSITDVLGFGDNRICLMWLMLLVIMVIGIIGTISNKKRPVRRGPRRPPPYRGHRRPHRDRYREEHRRRRGPPTQHRSQRSRYHEQRSVHPALISSRDFGRVPRPRSPDRGIKHGIQQEARRTHSVSELRPKRQVYDAPEEITPRVEKSVEIGTEVEWDEEDIGEEDSIFFEEDIDDSEDIAEEETFGRNFDDLDLEGFEL